MYSGWWATLRRSCGQRLLHLLLRHRIVFPSWSQTAIFCPAHFQSCNFDQLASSPSATGHWGVTGSARRRSRPRLRSPVSYTYKDLSRVDLDLPEGLLVGLGYAATSPDSPLDFRQAQNAAERSGVASPHRWSLMLPTSARVAQEVFEPLIGIQHPMLCSRMGDTWQIGTTSIREHRLIASDLRFVHWCHASPNVHARHNPRNDPAVRVCQHLEDQLTKAGADTDDILALTTTREGATNLRNYFTIAAIVASVAAGEDRGCPSCTSYSSFSVSRSETERTSGVALG